MSTERLSPIVAIEPSIVRGLAGVFCDVDDTLTWQGRLVPAAYTALCRAVDSGLYVVPVTGRPCGWAEVLAATWPVEAVIGEGGGAAALRGGGWMWWDTDEERERQRNLLDKIVRDVAERLPWAHPSADSDLRRVDRAWDIGEHFHASAEQVKELVDLIQSHGARTQVSTVHAHAIVSSYDKATMCARVAAKLWHEPAEALATRWLFIGDSPNDESCFRAFPISVGVANVRRFAAQLSPPPRYITTGEGGHGFAELIDLLLRIRGVG